MRTHRRYGMTLTETLMSLIILGLIGVVIISAYMLSLRVWRRLSTQAQAFPAAYVLLNSITSDLRNAAYVALPTTPAAWVTAHGYNIGTRVSHSTGGYYCIKAHTSSATNAPSTTAGATYWTADPGWVIIYHPAIDTTDSTREALRINRVPLVVDYTDVTRYYISDEEGDTGTPGTFLWRQEFSQNAAGTTITTIRNTVVARNVVNLSFQFAAANTGTVKRILAINAVALTMLGQEGQRTYQSNFSSEVVFHNPALVSPVNVPTF